MVDEGKDLTPTFRKMGDAASNMAQSAKNMASNPGTAVRNAMAYDIGKPIGAAVGVFTKGGMGWVWASVALFLLDLMMGGKLGALFGFNGIDFRSVTDAIGAGDFGWLIKSVINATSLIIIAAYIIFGRHSKGEIMTFSLLVIETMMILSLTGYFKGGPALVHLVFAWSMMFGLFYKAMPKQDAHTLLAIILFIDFFAFSILGAFDGLSWFNRLIIPIYFIISLSYTKESKMKGFLIFMLVIFYVLQVVATNADYKEFGDTLGDKEKRSFYDALGRAKNSVFGIVDDIKAGIKQEINDTKKDLQGTSYITEIDANSKKDLGVSLKLDEYNPTIYEYGETVTVNAEIQGRSLDDEKTIDITVTCTAVNAYDTSNKVKGKVNGQDSFNTLMYLYEPRSIICKFNKKDNLSLTTGSWNIKIETVFNFTSQAYLKTYFIDRERYVSLKSQKIDVFETFGITDKKPISKSVNGPGKVGIASATPPILVSRNKSENSYNTFIGVSLSNNWPGGRIKNLNDIELIIPNSIKLIECDNFIENGEAYNDQETLYRFTDEYKKKIKDKKIIETISERCNIEITNPAGLLGDAQFTTRYFKSNVKYNYLLKKELTITVKKKSTEK